jgi:hypothetical protein
MATNPQPSSILNRKVQFGTVNNTNGNTIDEPFRVFGPYAQGVQVTWLRTGTKAVIPLTTETGEGSFFLKLHYPNTSSTSPTVNKTMYVTFCQKNNTYDDGYKDFIQRVPEAYMTALKKWIDNGRAPSTSGVIRYRKLSFTAYGQKTSRVNNAVSFEMRFNYRGANVGTGGNTGGLVQTTSVVGLEPNTNNGNNITQNTNVTR